MSGDESVGYYVKHDDGDVQRLSLEQLDVAFQAGFIDAATRVLASDGTGWTTLGCLAGLDEPAPPVRPRAPSRAAIVPGPVPPMPVPRARLPHTRRRPARSSRPRQQPYQPPPLPSHRPVSVDLGVLDRPGQSQGYASQPPMPSKGRKWGWAVGIAAVAILGAGATVAARQPAWAARGAGPSRDRDGRPGRVGPTQVQWPTATTEPATPPPPVATPAPEPQVPSVTAAVPVPPPADTHADDVNANGNPGKGTHAPRTRPHHVGVATSRPRTAAKKSSASFTTGGNKFDPLNSTIQ